MNARYEDALCPLLGCGCILYITWKATKPVFLDDTVADLQDSDNAYSAGWEIGCEEGHIVLLPVNAPGVSRDIEKFGDTEDDPDGDYVANDLERLHALLGIEGN